MKTFYWLLKREYWEHRGGFLWAPVITGSIFLVLNIMGVIAAEVWRGREGVHIGPFNWPGHGQIPHDLVQKAGMAMDMGMLWIAGIIWFVSSVVVFFYCLGTLYEDRRDRSVLLWKSLPLSDRDTVLSKLVSAIVVAPLIAIVVGVLVGWLTLLCYAVTASAHGLSAFQLLWASHPLKVAGTLVAVMPVYVLWALPTAGWLLLCSAWARSKPFLWALLLPVGSAIVVSWLSVMGLFSSMAEWFWKHAVVRLLTSAIPGTWLPEGLAHDLHNAHDFHGQAAQMLDLMSVESSYRVLSHADIWIGAAVGVVMIAGAIWFRRWRDDS